MPETAALVVAAGRGQRLGVERPKQYLPLAGSPVLRHSVAAFLRHEGINAVRVVIHAQDRALYDEAVGDLALLEPVTGGATRQGSVRLGLESLEALEPDIVLIHDAARPCVTAALIDRVLGALEDATGALPAVAVSDCVKRAENGRVIETVDRAGLWRAQTPQAFRFRAILDAHRAAADQDLADDAAVAEAAGLEVALVEGSADNVKLTTGDDLAHAERLLGAAAETRVGFGFDVHRFGPGDHVMICGVRVPSDRGLVGHSDADVGLHALVDAVLGALGLGDIGSHFPPTDPRWRDADSAQFVAEARRLAAAAGASVIHVDVTLICEAPRLGPYRTAMVARIGELLGVGAKRVSVKATSTDRLGFTGRGEGIAAQAVATLHVSA